MNIVNGELHLTKAETIKLGKELSNLSDNCEFEEHLKLLQKMEELLMKGINKGKGQWQI